MTIPVSCAGSYKANEKGFEGTTMTLSVSKDGKSGNITITCVSVPPAERVACVDTEWTVNGKNQAVFSFDDDGWGGSGTGTIFFDTNRLPLKIV